jgi:hypothetical protein
VVSELRAEVEKRELPEANSIVTRDDSRVVMTVVE